MKQTTQPRIPGLSPDELRQLLHITPETLAKVGTGKRKAFTVARLWSIESRRKLASHRRRSLFGL